MVFCLPKLFRPTMRQVFFNWHYLSSAGTYHCIKKWQERRTVLWKALVAILIPGELTLIDRIFLISFLIPLLTGVTKKLKLSLSRSKWSKTLQLLLPDSSWYPESWAKKLNKKTLNRISLRSRCCIQRRHSH